ncbi:MAG: dihydroneopterin aldolase [Firmicutes bacterium]|nr:dihydroneopterin aldolase [Bacillota bacterium]
MDRIILTGMRFYGYHGVMPEETRLGQPFTVDVELYADLRPAGLSDQIGKTIHYGYVYETVKAVVEGPAYKLIEAVAEQVAQQVLGDYPVLEVVVRVHKPKAPIAGTFDNITVEVRRRREA